MISQRTIEAAVQRIVQAAHAPIQVILFGSYAAGNARDDSDLDVLVIEAEIPSPADEYSRLRSAIGPIGVGVDLLLYDQHEVERRRHWQTSPVHDAIRKGKVLYEVSVQTPLLAALASVAQATDSLAPSPPAGEGWGEGV